MGALTELDPLSGKRQVLITLTVGGCMARRTSDTWLDEGSPLPAFPEDEDSSPKARRWYAKGGLGFQEYAVAILGGVDVAPILRDRGTANFHEKYPNYGRPRRWFSSKHP